MQSCRLAEAHRLWRYAREIARISVNDSDEDTVKGNFKDAAQAFNEVRRPIEEASCYKVFSYFTN
jgi:hypothetical protein